MNPNILFKCNFSLILIPVLSILIYCSAFALTNSEVSSDYFLHTLFAGDSIMVGFKNAANISDTPLKESSYYCIGGYGVRTAIKSVDQGDVHPLYDNQIVNLWDAASDPKFDRLYLMFGLNDIGVTGVDKACDNYVTLVEKILSIRPDIDIIILSTTCILSGVEYPNLTNPNIALFNSYMKSICDEHGWTFLDISSSLNDENGNLLPQYCSDGYLHLNINAYEQKMFPLIIHNKIWTEKDFDLWQEQKTLPAEKKKHKEMTVLIL